MQNEYKTMHLGDARGPCLSCITDLQEEGWELLGLATVDIGMNVHVLYGYFVRRP